MHRRDSHWITSIELELHKHVSKLRIAHYSCDIISSDPFKLLFTSKFEKRLVGVMEMMLVFQSHAELGLSSASSLSLLVLTPSVSSTGTAIVTLSCSFYRENFVSIDDSTSSMIVSTTKIYPSVTDSDAVLGSAPDAYRRLKTTFSLATTDYALSQKINTFPPTPSFALDLVVGGTRYSYRISTDYWPVDIFACTLTKVGLKLDQKSLLST